MSHLLVPELVSLLFAPARLAARVCSPPQSCIPCLISNPDQMQQDSSTCPRSWSKLGTNALISYASSTHIKSQFDVKCLRVSCLLISASLPMLLHPWPQGVVAHTPIIRKPVHTRLSPALTATTSDLWPRSSSALSQPVWLQIKPTPIIKALPTLVESKDNKARDKVKELVVSLGRGGGMGF